MTKDKIHQKKCPKKLAKRMQECMSVIRPTHNKKTRNSHTSCRNYSCDPNLDLMAHLSLDCHQISQPQENYSSEKHRNSFDSFETCDVDDILNLELFNPLPVPSTYSVNSSTPMQDYLAMNDQNMIPPYTLNKITPSLVPFDQQPNMDIDPNFYGIDMNANPFSSNMIATSSPPVDRALSSPPVDRALPDTVSPSLQSSLSDMPSRPNPPSFTNGPQYFEASPNFRVSFESVDVDDSNFITVEELSVFLVNKDGSRFRNEAVMMIMRMFDKNKDYMIDINEFPEMLTFIKNWDSYFKYLDEDKTGTLDFREMNAAVKSLGLTSLSDMFITELIDIYVRDDNKRVHFDKFIEVCVTLCRYEEGYRHMRQLFGSDGFNIDLERFIAGSIYQIQRSS